MELLERAGIPRRDLLAAATTRAATLLGESDPLGTVEVGKKADLIIANRNPLEIGMRALRDLAYVMKNGEIRSPTAWMTEGMKTVFTTMFTTMFTTTFTSMFTTTLR